MLPLRGLRGHGVGEKVTARDGKILREFEGLPGGRPWEAGTRDWCPSNTVIVIILVLLVKDYL